MNKYQLNKFARILQHTVRNNLMEHYTWAYDRVLRSGRCDRGDRPKIVSAQRRQKLLFLIDQCLTPGKIRNNDKLLRSLNMYDDYHRVMQHVLNFRVPPVSFFEAEIKALQEEFSAVTYMEEERVICCVLGPYEIQDVDFGRFEVKLSSIVLGKVFPEYRPHLNALEPNYPPNGEGIYPHPHISRGTICLGDGEFIMAKAASEARILDYFTVLDSVMKTYGRDPYVTIEAWTGQLCEDCDRYYDPEENGSRCESCDEAFCSSCVGYCCDTIDIAMCLSCRREQGRWCSRCEQPGCSHCIKNCKRCGYLFCERHMEYHECFQKPIW